MNLDDRQICPGQGVHAFYLESDCVLFHQDAQTLFHLNATAGYVWCLLEMETPLGDIPSTLSETFGLAPDAARDAVLQALAMFEEAGVLANSSCRESDPDAIDPGPEAPESVVLAASSGPVFSCQLLSSGFEIRLANEAQRALVHSMLGHLAVVAAVEADAPRFRIDVTEDPSGQISIFLDGRCMREGKDRNTMAPMLKSLVWQTALLNHDFFLDIHAGVVGDGERCLMFPAAAGSGKTTLTAAMIHEGYEYLSDEVALLSLPEMTVEPMPMAMCVKSTGVDALLSRYPVLAELPEHLRGDGKHVRYLRPPAGSIPGGEARRAVQAIVFPVYRPGGATELQPLSVTEALAAFLDECLMVSKPLDVPSVGSLLDWFVTTPCYRLNIGNTEESVQMVRGLLGAVPRR